MDKEKEDNSKFLNLDDLTKDEPEDTFESSENPYFAYDDNSLSGLHIISVKKDEKY